MIRLRVTEGPAAGQAIEFDGEWIAGRAEEGTGRLGGDPELSRRHARVVAPPGGAPLVEDLGSTNGTYVNGLRLVQPIPLRVGDKVRVGLTTLEVESVGAPPPPPPPPPGPAGTEVGAPAPAPAGLAPVAATGGPAAALEIIGGPAAGQRLDAGGTLVLGRGEQGAGSLGGDPLLSRRHARISRTASGGMVVEDLGSTNGTFVGDERLGPPRPLQPGDVVRVGGTTLRVTPGMAPARPVAPPPPPAPAAIAALGAAAAPVRGAAGSRMSRGKIIGIFAGVFLVLVAAAVLVVQLNKPAKASTTCPNGMCAPPQVAPLHTTTVYTNATLGWRLNFDPDIWSDVTTDANGITLTANTSRAGSVTLRVQGTPAKGITPQTLIASRRNELGATSVGNLLDDTQPVHQVLGPEVGFRPGVGATWDGTANTPQGPDSQVVVFAEAATDGQVGIVATAITDTSDDDARLQILNVVDSVINTVRWREDTP